MKFTAKISKIEDAEIHWTSIIIIPYDVTAEMIKNAPNKQLICTINNSLIFRCAMMARKEYHFIMLAKDKIKTLNLTINDEFSIEIIPDKSVFGAAI